MQNCCVQIVNVDFVLRYIETELVGLADDASGFYAAPSHPHGECIRMVIPSVVAALNHWGSSEFPAPDYQSVFE